MQITAVEKTLPVLGETQIFQILPYRWYSKNRRIRAFRISEPSIKKHRILNVEGGGVSFACGNDVSIFWAKSAPFF